MSNYTLILITDNLLARIDVHVRSEVTVDFLETAVRPEHASLKMLLDSALSMGRNRPHRVWLVSNDFWTGSIRIPSDLHELANSDELNQAAILEAETQSGIPAFQSKVAMKRITDDNHGDPQYWVTQIQDDMLVGIEHAFRSAKVTWGGIAHLALHCPSHQLADATSSLDSPGNESEIKVWAQEIVKELSSKIARRPYFTAPPKVMSQPRQTMWAAFLVALTVAGCTSVYMHNRYTIHNVEQRSLSLAKQLDAVESLDRNLQRAESSLDEKRKKLQADTLRIDTLTQELDLNQFNQKLLIGHCSNLIDAIADSADADSWLQSIESNSNRTTLKGISLTEASAHRFASGLERQPKLIGHLVGPAQTMPLENELFEFSIAIDLITTPPSLPSSQESIQ